MKKWIVYCLLASLLLGIMPLLEVEARAASLPDEDQAMFGGWSAVVQNEYVTLENVQTDVLSIDQLREKFPHGMYWNHANNPGSSNAKNNQDGFTDTPCSRHGTIGTSNQTCNGFQPGNTQLSWQCMGYAEKLGYDATGFNPRLNENGWYTYTSVSALDHLKPGDIVRYNHNQHSIYVIAVDGDTVTYSDCNSDNRCVIRWDATISLEKLKKTFTHVRSAPSSPSTEPAACDCSQAYAGTYVCTTNQEYALNIRAGHGTNYGVVGRIPSGAIVLVTKASGTGEGDWAHVSYEGLTGYVSMQYLQLQIEQVYADLGTDFTAAIFNHAAWQPIESSGEEAVRLQAENGKANQLWYFAKQADGSYLISSCQDGKYLQVRDGVLGSGAAIETATESGSDSQKWYLSETDEGFVIQSKLTGGVLELIDEDPDYGLRTSQLQGTASQIWAIDRTEARQMKAPALNVIVGDTKTDTQLAWTDVSGEIGYIVQIYLDGTLYQEITTGSCEWRGRLPAGSYAVSVEAYHHYSKQVSQVATFVVAEHSHVYGADPIVQEPTCQQKGFTTYICGICGDYMIDDYVDAVDHRYADGVCVYCGEKEALVGDVNGDGRVDTTDAKLIMQYDLGHLGEDKLLLDYADFNGDGRVDTTDAKLIMQLDLGG